jgi:murein DD-endopeptidase MepM/ murein hydrolase activator NlpD
MRTLLSAILLLSAAVAGAETLSLPFEGRWFVVQGGDTPNVNHHMASHAQAYGADFAKVGGASDRELTRGQPTKVEDFYGWGEPVLAPAAGIVAAVVTNLPDNPLGAKDPSNPAGNHVVLRVDDGQFVFLGHLQRNSITVAKGDRVKRGRELGRCGNSGNSDYPHVHLHVQDTESLETGTDQIPIFGPIDVELTGKRFNRVRWPLIQGLFVSNAKKPADDRAARKSGTE